MTQRVEFSPRGEGPAAESDTTVEYGASTRPQARARGPRPDSVLAGSVDPDTPHSPGPTAGAAFVSAPVGEIEAGDPLERIAALEPKLARGLLVMLKMLERERPDAAARVSRSLEGLAAMLENGLRAPAGDLSPRRGTYRVSAQPSVAAASVQKVELSVHIEADLHVIETQDLTIRIQAGRVTIGARVEETALGDPLVLDLDGDGFDLSSVDDGVAFDLTGDGVQRQTAFVRGDDALLYLDDNGNGVVDDGHELFGDQDGHAHGFAELATYDHNADHRIDASDPVYEQLRLWQDVNEDGINQFVESMTLRAAGVAAIDLGYLDRGVEDGRGNTFAQHGSFVRQDGSRGDMVDALLRYRR